MANEAEGLRTKLNIEDVNLTSKPKTIYAKKLKNACKLREDTMMKTETCDMKKIRRVRAEELGLKDYVKNGNLWSVRKTWEARAFMLHVAGNYSHSRKYEATWWWCQACVLQV